MITIHLTTETAPLNITYSSGLTSEDLCIQVCKRIGIGPVARHLFALRNEKSRLWLQPSFKIGSRDVKFEFRLRFKPSTLQKLKQMDLNAYDYYFHQVRGDIMNNKVPDIVYEKHGSELVGLGVSDMYRVMLEQAVSREIVESNYKKYIPKQCVKKHWYFIKRPIHKTLSAISGHSPLYVKEQYLDQFQRMAPNYPYEEYKAFMDQGILKPPARVLLRVNATEIKYETENKWVRLCAIEDLCFISIRQDSTAEIARTNGIPSYLKFSTYAVLMSFVSALDGYYRQAVQWTFNLCCEAATPSLERLYRQKCHGPVGEEFSYSKLKEKRSNQIGTFILRESESTYDAFYLDVCSKDGKVCTHKITQLGPTEFVLADSEEKYTSLTHLIAAHQDPAGPLYLSECLPPSEYDNSPLLICANQNVSSDVAADEGIITGLLEGGPRCIPPQHLQIYKAQSFPNNNETEIPQKPLTAIYRAMWRVAKGKKLEAAIKVLREEEWKYSRAFLSLASTWGQLRSNSIVRLYGLTVDPTIGMLMELVKLGPLDVYLQNNSAQTVKTVDMVEAATCLANALWHLEENGVIHGNIRCRKLLVHVHTDNSFIVKLADPGLFSYTQADIHWLPPECHANPDLARLSTRADVWALGTTLWQIFSRGSALPVSRDVETIKKLYASGRRLQIPSGCPSEVYRLMTECWVSQDGPPKQPQAIMRDINQILYQVYNSRRTHAYATAFPKLCNDNECVDEASEMVNNLSLDYASRASSLFTDGTSLLWDDTDDSGTRLICTETDHEAEEELSEYLDRLVEKEMVSGILETRNRAGSLVTRIINDFDKHSIHSGGSLGQKTDMFELDADCNVILQGKIGQGFYGEVYRGTLERYNAKDSEPQLVAVKKLKTWALEADLKDFEREIEIMKTLKHPNVVEILGVISEPEVCLVMEFVKHGSLQSYLTIHRETLTPKRLLGFAFDIATGMDYLGQQSIVHRDLAARNILVADENRVKISDFGLAQVTGNNDYYILQTNRDLPIKWYAPESLRDGKFSPRSDVWSFGVTMYETFGLGADPKLPGISNAGNAEGESAEFLNALESGTRLPCPPNCPQNIYINLMYACWQLESHDRPDFATLCDNIQDLISLY